ncbi:MAG: hypothetical protein GXO42_01220 [bacterium]|nr:hypothetical protein [bacterium]
MNPEELFFAFLLACLLLYLLFPGLPALILILIIFLFFFLIYFGPYEVRPLPLQAYIAMVIFGSLWLFLECILGIHFFTWLFMIPPGPFTSTWSFFIPLGLVLFGLYGIIDEAIKKKILG